MGNAIEFGDWVKGASDAGNRTRGTIYGLTAVMAVSFSIFANTQLMSVTKGRESAVRIAKACLEGTTGPTSPETISCRDAYQYVSRLSLPTSLWIPYKTNNESVAGASQKPVLADQLGTLIKPQVDEKKAVEVRLDSLRPFGILNTGYPEAIALPAISKETLQGMGHDWMKMLRNAGPAELKPIEEQYNPDIERLAGARASLRTLSMPVFGGQVDIEFLGLISGLGLGILSVISLANIKRECQWLKACYLRIDPVLSGEQIRFIGLQGVLGSRSLRILPPLVFAFCPAVHLLAWVGDLDRVPLGQPMNSTLEAGASAGWLLFTIEILSLFLLVWVSALNVDWWVKLMRMGSEARSDKIGNVLERPEVIGGSVFVSLLLLISASTLGFTSKWGLLLGLAYVVGLLLYVVKLLPIEGVHREPVPVITSSAEE
ncbi:MAG: hypothetical protein P4L46_01725 [Fimbriimonas sp.]|nr:hypothetical protein [Fimbriimonas sp.]